MKKRIYALLVCLLLLTAFPLTAFADGESAPELTVACVRDEETLTVTVGIVNNPGIAGVDLALHFNDTVLTPSGEPTMAEDWGEYTTTNYDAPFSGDTLRVVGVREENVTEDGTLFTAVFTVKDDGRYLLRVDGTACAEAAEELIELPSAFGDDFGVEPVSCSESSVAATVVSHGSGYHGAARAILTCYQDGKFVGCVMKEFTVAQDGETSVTFENVSLSGDRKLLLTNASFTPLCAAMDVTP